MISIVTDSSCDLPDDLVSAQGVTVVPLTIRFGDDSLVDRAELTVHGFWDRLAGGGPLPETAAPSVGRFAEAFETAATAGAAGVVVITLSSAISGTHGAATLAARDAGIDVRVVDSRVVTGALGLIVLEAAAAARSGASLDDVERLALDCTGRANIFAALDTLEYLRKGGRIGAASAFFGSLLDVKPLITFADGAVAAGGRVRTRTKARAAVLDHISSVPSISRLGIMTTDATAEETFVQAVTEASGASPEVFRIGPVVGTHAGPGVLGVAYLTG